MPLEIGNAWQRAWDGTARRLFRPFVFRTWLWLGFSAWLANLMEQGFSPQVPGSFGDGGDGDGGAAEGVDRAGEWIGEHLGCILAVAIPILLLAIAAVVVLSYLKARAEFVFLDQVVHDHLRFDAPWHAYRREGRSLFLWRWGLVGVALGAIALLVGLGILLWLPARHGADAGIGTAARIALTAPILLLFLIVVLAAVLADFLSKHFVVPIMARHHLQATAAWRRFLPLLRANAGGFAVYVLLTLAVWLGVGLAILFAGCLTCCIGFVLLAIPWLGTLPLLPVLVFFRLLSVHYLAQLGPDVDLFAAPAPVPAVP
ncbi:MAG TPA: hypothetical protein VF121_09700 [Thermoanaerobaculia bacterium]|nr:hypothetical protein [Thermoanaerobaculia bacterium]